MLMGREIRLLPTMEQEELLYGHAGIMRFAYNFCKSISEIYYNATGEPTTSCELTDEVIGIDDGLKAA